MRELRQDAFLYVQVLGIHCYRDRDFLGLLNVPLQPFSTLFLNLCISGKLFYKKYRKVCYNQE